MTNYFANGYGEHWYAKCIELTSEFMQNDPGQSRQIGHLTNDIFHFASLTD